MTNLEKVNDIFKEYALPEVEITEFSSFQDLGMDSIMVVEATIKLEEKYKVEITLSEDVKSVGDILKQFPTEEGAEND